MKFQNILFDLDGTLTDSVLGITRTIRHTLASYGIEQPEEALRRFVGPPLRECFTEFLGAERAEEAVGRYRLRYNELGVYENAVYDGVPELLQRLRDAGLTLAVATSKNISSTRKIVAHFDLERHFAAVEGASEDGRVAAKHLIVANAMAALSADPAHTVMIGDRLHDMEGAATNGIPAIGVLWGYGGREELAAYHPLLLAETPAALADFLLAD